MHPTKLALLSLTQDLTRIAMSINRGSSVTATRFSQEAKRWLAELEHSQLDKRVQKIIQRLSITVDQENEYEKADDCLTYSVILQNYAFRNFD